MISSNKRLIALFISVAAVSPIVLLAHPDGADPRLTGAPGEQTCLSCHTGTGLNSGSGSIKILVPGDNTYTPGVKQRIRVQVSDSAQRRWGFELSARSGANAANRAGDLTTVDSNTQVVCQGRCSATSIQYATHTVAGTRPGTTGGATFELDWTPPATDVGTVTLYAAGNAANNNGNDTGDHIYTTSLQLTPVSASANNPAISSDSGVVNGASFQPGIAAGAYVTVRGTNLASTTRLWADADFVNGNLPTSLDNVSVTINNKPAYVEYISPTQINVIAPADDATGNVEVKVTNNGQTSAAAMAMLQPFAPAFFAFDGKYLAATHADGSLAGKAGLFASAPNATSPVKPGETIILYGTGFGPTNPAVPSGQKTTTLAPVTNRVDVTIGGQPATVAFAGLIPPYAELYQFNVVVPASVGNGDQQVVASVGGQTSTAGDACCFVTVQQ